MTEPEAVAQRSPGGRRRVLALALWTGLALLALAYVVALYTLASEPREGLSFSTTLANVREVDPGKFYRSGQLDAEQLREVVREFRIRSVVNLRGHDTSQPWYREEAKVTRELGIELFNVHLSATGLPQPQEVWRLLHLYRHAKRPMLVHCDGGADRAGEASALYQIEYMDRTPEEALEMLTLRYRHLSWLRPAKRYFIQRYRGEDWARYGYDPCDADYEYYDKEKYCS